MAAEAEAEAGTEDPAEDYIPPGWVEAFLPRRDRRYLAVTGAVAAISALTLGTLAPDARLIPAMVGLSVLGTLIGAGDAVTRHIPNKANAVALASCLPLLGLARLSGDGSLRGAALGAVAAFLAYFALWLVAPASMGLGDVKLSPYLGAYLGYFGLTCWTRGLVAGFLAQGLVVGIGLAARRLTARSHVAHGPAMCVGTAAAVLWTIVSVGR
ncbi:MAG: prepilin peptidase [Acidimicrobiales bacterium]